jgi:hypothetical protein
MAYHKQTVDASGSEVRKQMSKFDETQATQAIAEAVAETVATFGIGFVRTLSFFPSSEKVALAEAA